MNILSREHIAEIDASFPVQYAILEHEHKLFIAYYDVDHHLIVTQRQADKQWSTHTLPTQIGYDSHNYIAMCFDKNGHLHLSANMHVDPLVYFISDNPYDISSWTQQSTLMGDREDACTYPAFLYREQGELIFHYRDGSSGNGCEIFNAYNADEQQWSRLLDVPLLDGYGQMNAYTYGPICGPDKHYHMCWVWRDTPAADSNHDLSYASSPNMIDWFNAAGEPLSLPIDIDDACIVDPVAVECGMINGNNIVCFDQEQRPVIIYHKFDQAGKTQVYSARFEQDQWVIKQITQWDYRWEFGGWGSLEFEIDIGQAHTQDSEVLISYKHAQHGDGVLHIDAQDLSLINDQKDEHFFPPELYHISKKESGMRSMIAGSYPSQHILRWATHANNRDQKPDDCSARSNLELIALG